MFEEDDLEPRTSFRPTGEEIDGSILLGDRHILVEAKWTSSPQPASSLYAFKGKVDGKLVGTIGAFFSMNGYSRDSIKALISGKDLNLILFDGEDLDAIASEAIGIRAALLYKLRAAAEEGTPYAPLTGTNGVGETTTIAVENRSEAPALLPATLVVVEGKSDEVIVREIIQAGRLNPLTIRTVAVGGRSNLGRIANFVTVGHQFDRLIILSDGDGSAEKVRRDIYDQLDDDNLDDDRISVVVLEPSLGDAISVSRPDRMDDLGHTTRRTLTTVRLRELATTNPSIALLLDALGIAWQR